MNVPVFIEIEVEEQAEELRAYFKGLGAEIAPERSDKGFEDDLHKIIGVCDACFKVRKDCLYLNNYFDFHACLSIRPSVRSSVRPCVCPKISSISCSRMTKCH